MTLPKSFREVFYEKYTSAKDMLGVYDIIITTTGHVECVILMQKLIFYISD